MKKLNKKGFTLIELLAVIVVLAVIMLLAVNAVIPQMEKARKNAFLTEAESVINAASAYYQNAVLTNTTIENNCISVEDLKGEYLDKNSANFTGSVKIDTSNAKTQYTVWLSNGKYAISKAVSGGADNAEITLSNVTESTDAAATNCPAS